MFSKPLFIALLVLSLIKGVVFFSLFDVTDEDRIAYQQLMNTSEIGATEAAQKQKTEQQRSHIHKQILLTKGKERLETHLTSDHSELVLDHLADKSEIVEKFTQCTCSSQEELLDNPSQQVLRVVNADTATYHYRTGVLQADKVQFARYRLPGHNYIVPESHQKPMMTGEANEFELSLNEKASFKAQGMKLKGALL